MTILVIPTLNFFYRYLKIFLTKYGRQLTSKYFWICTLLFSITCLSIFCWNMNLKLCVGNSKLFKFEQSGRNFRCNPWNCARLRETTQPELMPSSFTDSLSIICTTITKYGGSFSSRIYQEHDKLIILLFWRFFKIFTSALWTMALHLPKFSLHTSVLVIWVSSWCFSPSSHSISFWRILSTLDSGFREECNAWQAYKQLYYF